MKYVLVVEDNAENSDMLSRRLRRRGYEVEIAADGLAALDSVASRRPDIVLLDLSLPGIDGWEVARRLRANPEFVALRLIALTAHAMSGDRERAIAAGCDEYETKPVNLNTLLEKIEQLT